LVNHFIAKVSKYIKLWERRKKNEEKRKIVLAGYYLAPRDDSYDFTTSTTEIGGWR
jgi:hypothetical protein